MLGFTILASQGFPSNCSLFRALLCWGGGSVAFEVFSVYSGRDCNCHSDIVLLVKLAGAVLYLECRLLDMRTGAPDSGPDLHRGVRGEYPAAEIDYGYRGLRGRTSRKTSVDCRTEQTYM